MIYNPYYQAAFNPYMVRNNMFPTQMSGTSQIGLNGRIVDDFATIIASDVPMDEFGAIFIKADGSEAVRKIWTNSGTIKSVLYKAVLDDKTNNPENYKADNVKSEKTALESLTGALSKKLDYLTSKFEDFEKILTKNGGGLIEFPERIIQSDNKSPESGKHTTK